jgi:curved DNA-binding protein
VHDTDIFDLIVGGRFDFTTLSGKTLTVTIPPKTQPGSKLRLAKEGLPFNNDFGDQYILLKPYIPDTIDSDITDSILQSKHK